MRSFIVRLYRCSSATMSGTVQPVGGAAQPAPLAFASAAELLACMQAGAWAKGAWAKPGPQGSQGEPVVVQCGSLTEAADSSHHEQPPDPDSHPHRRRRHHRPG